MTRRLGRRSGAAVVLLIALFAVVPASPAGATPVIAFGQPDDGQTLDSGTVTIAGRVTDDSAFDTVKDVSVSVGEKRSPTFECSEVPCSFSWRVTLPLNGPYQAKVTANEVTILLGTPGTPATQTRSFKVAAPPAKPVLDPPKVNDARNVELSWSRNTEPDMLYYAVFRKDPGGDFRQVGGKVTQPASGAKVAYTDTTTSAFTGGDYAYRVVAVRKGASGTADTEVTSTPSSSGSATVPALPATSTAALAPGTAAPAGGGPTTTAKPGPPAGVDLSGFLSSRSQAAPVAPITVPEAPDTGFKGTLPFGARPPGDEVEEGEAEAVPPRGRGPAAVSTRIGSGRPLVPVAGGLVLLLLAMHMRLLNRRIKEVPVGDLPVEAPPARATVPAPSDVVEEEDEDDWGPVDADPESDSEPVPEPVADVSVEAPPARVTVPEAPAPVGRPPRSAVYDVVEEQEDWAVDANPEPDLDDYPYDEKDGAARWAPPADAEDIVDDAEEIEVFEVVSPNRRRLARAGSR